MSDGRKRAYEDDQEAILNARVKLFQEKSAYELLDLFDKIRQELDWLNLQEIPMSRTKHGRADSLKELIKKLP